MGTKASIAYVHDDGSVTEAFLSYDGDILFRYLLRYYNTDSKAINLVFSGNYTEIRETFGKCVYSDITELEYFNSLSEYFDNGNYYDGIIHYYQDGQWRGSNGKPLQDDGGIIHK